MAPRDLSSQLWEQSKRVIPGGVNSPVRAFNAVGGTPIFVESGVGPYITTADGDNLIDYVLSWGPLVLGHAHPEVVQAVSQAAAKGCSFGIPTEAEAQLAEAVIRHFPSIDKLRLVNSGTEATMSAIRLARGFTGRDLVVKVQGCYHGHVDGLLVAAGSGPATFGSPDSPGVPQPYAECTLTVPFNDLESAREAFSAHGERIACMIVEPVAGNMGLVPPLEGYLDGLRELTRQHDALLIFDEVMTGFRVSMGGAQERFGIRPDLTALGKVIGGGLPVGAYGGRADIMAQLAPEGPVYQAGTLSGNPLATAAGLTTIRVLEQGDGLDAAEGALSKLCEGLRSIAKDAGVPVCINQAGAMGCMFFTEGPVTNYGEAKQSDTDRYARWFWACAEAGVYVAPSQFEVMFTSIAHTEDIIEDTLEAASDAFKRLGG
jgi:glutamate-1-semialdehyde 2,1-aminomutase